MTRRTEGTITGCTREVVTYATAPLLDVSSNETEKAKDLLTQVIAGELPGFVLRSAGLNPTATLGIFEDTFSNANFHRTNPADLHTIADAEHETVLHMDGIPTLSRQQEVWAPRPATGINHHTTLAGAGLARFFEPTDTYMQHLASMERDNPKSMVDPRHIIEDYEQGLADPCYLNPSGWHAELNTGDGLFFRSIGLRPLYHKFTTTEFPRTFALHVLTAPDAYQLR